MGLFPLSETPSCDQSQAVGSPSETGSTSGGIDKKQGFYWRFSGGQGMEITKRIWEWSFLKIPFKHLCLPQISVSFGSCHISPFSFSASFLQSTSFLSAPCFSKPPCTPSDKHQSQLLAMPTLLQLLQPAPNFFSSRLTFLKHYFHQASRWNVVSDSLVNKMGSKFQLNLCKLGDLRQVASSLWVCFYIDKMSTMWAHAHKDGWVLNRMMQAKCWSVESVQ